MPPPNTRSSSSMPVERRGGGGSALSSGENSTVPVRVFVPRGGRGEAAGRRAMVSSTSVFHAPQPSQRPDHLAWAVPQDWQT